MNQADDYQELAKRSAGVHESQTEAILNWTLGLTGEAGEVANKVKKQMFHGHNQDGAEILDECGDVLWYLSQLLGAYGFTLSECMHQNIHKLIKRYPITFSQEASRQRVDVV